MEPGQLIDHYRLVSLVGAGSMGEVYRAVDERLRRDVAIKVLSHSGAPADLREAQAAGHLNHPGIVTIHDVGRWADRTYIVMELVDGRSLSELAATDIGAARAVALCRQAAEAMAVAHERGILHRDIKPDNLMVTRDDRVKILDFGIAKLYDPSASLDPDPDPEADIETDSIAPAPALAQLSALPDESSRGLEDSLRSPSRTPATYSVTGTGALLGTPAYMSPEQAAGAPVDELSEVYSLGLVLYELLTGVRPLRRATLIETLAVARDPAIPPASAAARGRDIPRACDRLLERALARAPANRHPTMRALADDLAALEQALTRPRRAGRRWLLAGSGLAAFGAAGAALVSLEGGRDEGAAAPAIATTGVRRLTFDPGCEELPAFWPDGRSIVFDAVVDGDTELVRMDLESGARQRLTRNPGWDMAAQVSPDGRSIAFVRFTESGRTLMVMPWQDGAAGPARPLRLVRGNPGWSADGAILVGDDRGGILRVDPRVPGGAAQVVASRAGYVSFELEEMATADVLAAVRLAGQDPNRMELGLVRPGGGALDMIDMPPVIDAVGIARDAAARGFYFADMTATGPRLYWRSLDGRQQAELPSLPLPYGGMAADRSGTRLVLSNCRQVFQVGRFEGGDRFTPMFAGRDWNDINLAALPDGSYLFASDRSGETQIWRGRPGEAPRLIIDRGANFPAVSPDGSMIAWIATERGNRGVYLSGVDGSSPRRLTTDESDDQPVFSGDGQSLFLLRGSPEGTRVFEVPLAGGEARPVTPLGAESFAVAPGRTRRLAWLVQTSAGRELRIGEPGGEGAAVPGLPSGNYTEVRFALDGKTLWLVRSSIEILAISIDGAAPPAVVWHTTNDLVGFIAPDPDGSGIVGDVASYEGDIYLVEGRFR